MPDLFGLGEVEDMYAKVTADNGGIAADPGRVKGPGIQAFAQLPLGQTAVKAAVEGGTRILGLGIGQFRKPGFAVVSWLQKQWLHEWSCSWWGVQMKES